MTGVARALSLIDHIRNRLPQLKPAEAKVAALVADDPGGVLRANLTMLARRAEVSEATIVRFCRSIDCEGFADFKLKLAQSVAKGTPFVSHDVEPHDDAATYTRKIFAATADALYRVGQAVDAVQIGRAVDLLAAAPRILCLGMGGSGAVAQDAQHKFLRLGILAHACSDPVIARMAITALGPNDVLLAVSNTGRTLAVLDLAEMAVRDQQVRLVGITAPQSPLAALCDAAITIPPIEDADLYTPLASRIAHLVTIDTLTTGVGLRIAPGVRGRMARIKEALRDTRSTAPVPALPPAD